MKFYSVTDPEGSRSDATTYYATFDKAEKACRLIARETSRKMQVRVYKITVTDKFGRSRGNRLAIAILNRKSWIGKREVVYYIFGKRKDAPTWNHIPAQATC